MQSVHHKEIILLESDYINSSFFIIERKMDMPEELEIEFKNMLTEEEFEKIRERLSISENDFSLQQNHYFETPDDQLRENKCALRVREKNGGFEFTLKQPADEGLLETNQPVSAEETSLLLNEGRIPSGEVESALHGLGITAIKYKHLGTLSTKRAETSYKEGLLVLDYSFYLNEEDFELEYEVKDRDSGEEKFLGFLKEMDITFRPAENKIKRFLRAAESS